MESKTKIIDLNRLLLLKSMWNSQKQTIVLCQGCFDVLHRGHIHLLGNAKKHGDILIVALNSDESVRRLKGSTRPIIAVEDRSAILAAIEYVDYISIFDSENALDIITQLRPDVYIDDSVRDHNTIEAKTVAAYGGKLVKIQYLAGYSTTELIQRIMTLYNVSNRDEINS